MTGPDLSALVDRARAWLAEDPDPDTREELAALIDAALTESGAAESGSAGNTGGAGGTGSTEAPARQALAERFAGHLAFGTAGLRAELGAGPLRMNRSVVIRTAAGLAAHLRDLHLDQDRPLVVIGHDARHKSADFARDTAAVVTGAGLRAALLPGPLPTPVLAFAIRHLGAVAGVAVTASHNPPRDNGYKVYLADGSQIVPPTDSEIAERIAAVGPLDEVARPGSGWAHLGQDLVDAYLDRTGEVLHEGTPRTARTVSTPLHGVGQDVLTAAFVRAGFPAPIEVPEQSRPDPDFPTVAFPNPEEPGAMDLAFAAAREATAAGRPPELVIANDPDADRCAVAVPDPAAAAGWRMLHGDEVGALLAEHLVRHGARGTFATTIVSSTLTGRIAAAAGLPHRETLTGFKWLARVDGLRYAYEEALGYCVDPDGVRDKDGISAALLIAELAGELREGSEAHGEGGRTLTDLLDDLALRHGLHATDQLSVRVEDLGRIGAAMARLRGAPPAVLAGRAVRRTDDLREGGPDLPPTDGLRYVLDGARVVVRPSGTEPKLKCYLEVVQPVEDRSHLPAARHEAAEVLARLKQDLSRAAGI